MTFDIYYSYRIFEVVLKYSSNNTMPSAYMKVVKLMQYKKKTQMEDMV